MRQTHAPLSRRGFSLIEILVAMTILVVIVLIVAGSLCAIVPGIIEAKRHAAA